MIATAPERLNPDFADEWKRHRVAQLGRLREIEREVTARPLTPAELDERRRLAAEVAVPFCVYMERCGRA